MASPNKALHRTEIPLRSITAGELGRSAATQLPLSVAKKEDKTRKNQLQQSTANSTINNIQEFTNNNFQ